MNWKIVIVGLFIIVLIMTAGCTSTQSGTATGIKNQTTTGSSPSGNTVSGTLSPPQTPHCQEYTKDIHQFKKFFPDIAGYTRRFKNDNKYDFSLDGYGKIEEQYWKSEYWKSGNNYFSIQIFIYDLSNCNYDTNEITNRYGLNQAEINIDNMTMYNSKINYHGYPTYREEIWNTGDLRYINLYILINTKMMVYISTQNMSKSEADAEFEKLGNALDFNGIATMP